MSETPIHQTALNHDSLAEHGLTIQNGGYQLSPGDPFVCLVEEQAVADAEKPHGHDLEGLAKFRESLSPAHESDDRAEAARVDPDFDNRTNGEQALIETVVDVGGLVTAADEITTPSGKARRRWIDMGDDLDPQQAHDVTSREYSKDLFTHEAILSDIKDRLKVPMGQRKGSEVVDKQTGEIRKPCIELYCSPEASEEIAAALDRQEEGLQTVTELLDRLEATAHGLDVSQLAEKRSFGSAGLSELAPIVREDIQTDIVGKIAAVADNASSYYREWVKDENGGHYEARVAPDILRAMFGAHNSIALQSGLSGSRVEVEGLEVGGDASDLFYGPDDIAKRDQLVERIKASTIFGDEIYDRDLEIILGYDQTARVEASVESLLPEGSELFHSTKRVDDILASGMFGSRISAGLKHSSETGTHSNLLHFGEAGKINGHYGNQIIGVKIEDIVSQAPYIMQERGYEAGAAHAPAGSFMQHLGKVELSLASDAALVVKNRAHKISQRHSNGLIAQGTDGSTNNITFAASQEVKEAGFYSFPTEKCTITTVVPEGEDSPLAEQLLHQGYDWDWVHTHVRSVLSITPNYTGLHPDNLGLFRAESHYAKDVTEKTSLTLPVPAGIMPDKIVGYTPISTKVVSWTESDMTRTGQVDFIAKPTLLQKKDLERQAEKARQEKVAADAFAREAKSLGVTPDELHEIRAQEIFATVEAADRAAAAGAGMTYEQFIELPPALRPGEGSAGPTF